MLKTVGFPSIRNGDQTIVNGNLVIGTSGKGIDFSATPGTGTSELLSDYEEGEWTPALTSGFTVTGTLVATGTYTKIGRMVYVRGAFSATSISATAGLSTYLTGLPFAVFSSNPLGGMASDTNAAYIDGISTFTSGRIYTPTISGSAFTFALAYQAS